MHSSNLISLRHIAILCLVLAGVYSGISSKLLAQPCGGYGQKGDATSLGTEFLLCFMANETVGFDPFDARYQDIYLASTDQPADITITCRAFPKWSHIVHLNTGAATSYRISSDPVIGYPTQDAIIESSELINQTVFKVVSTTPIACYGMNNKHVTADAFLALPKSVAGYDYLVMSYYTSTQLVGQEQPSEFCVASFEHDNTVTIVPTALTRNGNPAGQKMTFVLDSGEAVQIQADPFTAKGDLTGSSVTSTKKVVVYGGHARTEVPTGYFTISQGGRSVSRDHLCEAIPPIQSWGTSFITKNFGREDGDILRVLAKAANDTVKINGKQWGAPFKANEFRDYTFLHSDTALNNIATVESNYPILVGMIAHSASSTSGIGDPFLAIVPPLDESFNDFTYFISNDSEYFTNEQFLIIATEVSGAGTLSIDNVVVPKLAYSVIPSPLNGGKHYAAATISQSRGIHRIISPRPPTDGFTILAYGWGSVISYGYTAGYLLKPITGILPKSSPSHTYAPRPGEPVPVPPSTITVKDILTERAYFDSVKIMYTQNKGDIAVHLKNDIATEIGTIEPGEEKTLELTTSKPVEDVTTGNVRIWYHSRLWVDMLPVDFPFIITPQPQADVKNSSTETTILENYPNPVSGRTTVHFRIPSRAYATVKIYDALGRVARIVSQSVMSEGEHSFNVNTSGLAAGSYTIELLAPEIGVNEHSSMIVIE